MSRCEHLARPVWLVCAEGRRAAVAAPGSPWTRCKGKGPHMRLWEAAELTSRCSAASVCSFACLSPTTPALKSSYDGLITRVHRRKQSLTTGLTRYKWKKRMRIELLIVHSIIEFSPGPLAPKGTGLCRSVPGDLSPGAGSTRHVRRQRRAFLSQE